MKLLIKYDNYKLDTLCMSDIGLIINGQSYVGDDNFVKLVEKHLSLKNGKYQE